MPRRRRSTRPCWTSIVRGKAITAAATTSLFSAFAFNSPAMACYSTEMNGNSIDHEYGPFFKMDRERTVIFYYVGYFSQNIIAAMSDAVRLQLTVSGVDGSTRRKLFSSFVEMAQNIVHYSSDALTPPTQDSNQLRHGSVCICMV